MIPAESSFVLYGSASLWCTAIPMTLLLNGAVKKSLYLIYHLGMVEYTDTFQIFYIKIKQHDGSVKKFIIEIKPKKQCSPPEKKPKRKTKKWFNEVKTWGVNEAKWKYATEWCGKNDMEFKILTEDHLNIRYK